MSGFYPGERLRVALRPSPLSRAQLAEFQAWLGAELLGAAAPSAREPAAGLGASARSFAAPLHFAPLPPAPLSSAPPPAVPPSASTQTGAPLPSAPLHSTPPPAVPVFEPLFLDSPGDRDLGRSLLDGDAPDDFFTRDLDRALLEGAADCALHSAKDLPWPLPRGLEVWALTPAAAPGDELVSRAGWNLDELPAGARVGTSSPLRRDKLAALRPDLRFVSLRGAIHQRLAYLDDGRADAVVVAACALRRLGLPAGAPLPFAAHPLQGRLAVVGRSDRARLRQAFAAADVRRSWGSVAIVGGGPGPRAYLTLRAAELLERAEVVYYDALLDPAMLDGLRAETVYVGKRRGVHEKTQDEINELLCRAAEAGRRVVRLKGGDPLVFGRGSEEAAYLGRRLVDYEIVSGVSSALAAAACAGVPLSERGRAASIAFVNSWPADRLRWTQADTQAFYMPSAAAAELAARGLAAGAPADLPVAWVRGAAGPDQDLRVGRLDGLADLAQPPGDGPVLLLAGPTIDGRAGNDWFDRLPRVLYTGAGSPPSDLRGRVVHLPLVRFEPIGDDELGAGADLLLPPWRGEWLAYTSPRTVAYHFALLARRGLDARALHGLSIAAIGRSSAAALSARGLAADLTAPPDAEHSQGLVAALAERLGPTAAERTVLLPRSDRALDLIPDGLAALGCAVRTVALYRTLPPLAKPELDVERFDEVVFTSPSTVEHFFDLYGAEPGRQARSAAWLERVAWHCRGPQTGAALAARLSRLAAELPQAAASGGTPPGGAAGSAPTTQAKETT